MTSSRDIRRFASILVVVIMTAVACSTGDDSSADTTTTTEGTVETTTAGDTTTTGDSGSTSDGEPRTASFRGVTEDTIQIGVGFWDTSAFGFGFLGDAGAVWDALTAKVNEAGGINGRNLEYTISSFNPADNEGMLASCIEFTEDAQVFAVLGGMRGDANFCIFEQHETALLGSQVVAAGEALERTKAPIAGLLIDGTARETAFIAELDTTAWFDGATAVGVHYDGTDTEDRIGADVEAAFADADVEIVLTMNIDDLVLDEDTLEAQAEIMEQQVRDAGLDRMVIFGPAATGFIVYGDLGIELAAVDSSNFTTAILQGIDPADLDGTIASAAKASLPTDPIDDLTQQCIDDVQAALPEARFEQPAPGVENSEDDPNYWSYTVLACRDLSLFVDAAVAAGVELTNDSLQSGLESLSDLSLPEIEFASYGPGKYNGSDTFRLVEFDAGADDDGELVAGLSPIW
ncbi:MAG: hypothetical protein IH940_11010 [Acidobacteria bacterium]|nr:hypothetical protein [Acidobacteriota bacterium]